MISPLKDKLGNIIDIGSYFAYSIKYNDTAILQFGWVTDITGEEPNRKIHVNIFDEKSLPSYHKTIIIYPCRMVILNPVFFERTNLGKMIYE